MLKNTQLTKLLDKIDNSKHRITELQTSMLDNQNGEFMTFVEEVLQTLNVKDEENGGFKWMFFVATASISFIRDGWAINIFIILELYTELQISIKAFNT